MYGEDEIAYQIGETTAILSSGYLCATPHCVRVIILRAFVDMAPQLVNLFVMVTFDCIISDLDNKTTHNLLFMYSGTTRRRGSWSRAIDIRIVHAT